jgi:ubiquinone/menaquinone biosynthesis C-methylase UbiE
MSRHHNLEGYRRRLQRPARAEKYANRFESGSRRRIDRREQRAVGRIFAGLEDCRSVADVPCGAGRFLAVLAHGGRSVLEIDVALEILMFAKEKIEGNVSNALALRADAVDLPLPDAGVDCVFSNRLLHHILSPAERVSILREFHRVTRRWAVISFFNYKGMAGLRSLLKRLKGRRPPYEGQPTLEQSESEAAEAGFAVRAVVPTGAPWVSQKYMVLEKNQS